MHDGSIFEILREGFFLPEALVKFCELREERRAARLEGQGRHQDLGLYQTTFVPLPWQLHPQRGNIEVWVDNHLGRRSIPLSLMDDDRFRMPVEVLCPSLYNLILVCDQGGSICT